MARFRATRRRHQPSSLRTTSFTASFAARADETRRHPLRPPHLRCCSGSRHLPPAGGCVLVRVYPTVHKPRSRVARAHDGHGLSARRVAHHIQAARNRGGLQFILSNTLSRGGSKSRGVFLLAVGVTPTTVTSLDGSSPYLLYAEFVPSCLLSLARVIRMILMARGTPKDADKWLQLGQGSSGVQRVVAALAAGALL
eukprot:7167274-Prymnesium_polylepis.1